MMKFESNSRPMSSELPKDASRQFHPEIEGTAELTSVELLRDGKAWLQWTPGKNRFQIEAEDKENNAAAFYRVRATQEDGHKGWTSPI